VSEPNGGSVQRPIDLRRLSLYLHAFVAIALAEIDLVGRLNGLPESVTLLALSGAALGSMAGQSAPFRCPPES